MDNKENRQFYWEVKQFINGNHTPKAPEVKKPSVKDAISGVLSENEVYRQNTFTKNTGTNDVVRSYLNVLGTQEKKNDPGTIMFTKNSTFNPFNILNEAEVRGMGPMDGGDAAPGKTRWRDPKYAAIQKHMEEVAAKDAELKAIRKQTREKDEELAFRDELETAGIAIPKIYETDAEGNKTEKEYAAPAAARMLASLSKEDRKKLEQHREEQDKETFFKLKERPLNSLSSDELWNLKRIQKAAQRKDVETYGVGFGYTTPMTEAEDEEERRLEPVIDSIRQSVKKFKDEAAEKVRNTAISPGYRSVTPASFEAAYGVPYDPRNPKHGTMIQALHGENAGKYIQGAGTVSGWKDVMGQQRYSDLTKEKEQKVRDAQQRIDAIKFDIFKHKEMTPAERTAENAAERAELLKSKPEAFMKELDVQGIYQNKGGLNTPVEVPPWEASKGMSQRAVASRAATMFGSGRAALGSTNRMNA